MNKENSGRLQFCLITVSQRDFFFFPDSICFQSKNEIFLRNAFISQILGLFSRGCCCGLSEHPYLLALLVNPMLVYFQKYFLGFYQVFKWVCDTNSIKTTNHILCTCILNCYVSLAVSIISSNPHNNHMRYILVSHFTDEKTKSYKKRDSLSYSTVMADKYGFINKYK